MQTDLKLILLRFWEITIIIIVLKETGTVIHTSPLKRNFQGYMEEQSHTFPACDTDTSLLSHDHLKINVQHVMRVIQPLTSQGCFWLRKAGLTSQLQMSV